MELKNVLKYHFKKLSCSRVGGAVQIVLLENRKMLGHPFVSFQEAIEGVDEVTRSLTQLSRGRSFRQSLYSLEEAAS